MKIIDSHIHFWNTDRFHYHWMKPGESIERPFEATEYAEARAGIDVEGVVFIQADCAPEDALPEARWVATIGAPILGIIGRAPLELGASRARDTLDALKEMPLTVGVRRLIQWEPAGFCVQPKFVEAVQSLQQYDLPFDICIFYHQFGDALKLVESCPNIRFVLDHFGKPDIAQGEMRNWSQGISALARHENVWCKLSGLVTEADHQHWTPDQLRPYVDHALEVSGARRMMFGSDWPVATVAASYKRWYDTARQFVSHLSEDEQTQIFAENAARFYRLKRA